jgi:glucokinase
MYLLFDIGGTKMRLAISRDLESFGGPKIFETPANYQDGRLTIRQIIKEISGQPIEKAAGGIAGAFSKDKSSLYRSPNLSGWEHQPLKDDLETLIGAPVSIQNDSAMAALGEATFGAGKNYRIVVYITVSTGVGGARIVNGKIDENVYGFEPGHQIVAICDDSQKSGVKSQKYFTLENLISGKAVEQGYRKKPAQINDQKIWDELAQFLAVGLNNSIVHWSPDIIVLGGSMITKTPGISIEQVKQCLTETLKIFPEPPPIVQAKLQDLGGLWGALAYLKQHR